MADPKGFCPSCERFMRVKADGTLRHHGGPVGSGYAYAGRVRAHRCNGAGRRPVQRLTGRGLISGRDITGEFVSTWVSSGQDVATLRDDDGELRVVYARSVRVAGDPS